MTDLRDGVTTQLTNETQAAVTEVTRLPQMIASDQCVITAKGLMLKDSCSYNAFAQLIRRMDGIAYAHSVRDVLFKFYVGDAFNGGEKKFGEGYAQVLHKLHWTQGYLSNIQWISRSVPHDLRDIKLNNWKFWAVLAPLEYEDQKHWVSQAMEELKMGSGWFERVKVRLDSDLMRKEIDSIEDDDSLRWTHVKQCKAAMRVPYVRKTPANWWIDAMDEAGYGDEEQAAVLELAMAFVKDVNRRRIKL
jgi:hypothetical protein